MVLQHDICHIDSSTSLTTTEVEYQHHLVHINTWHVTLPEDIVLTRLQVDTVSEIEYAIVTIEHQFHSSTIQVLVAIEDSREVVVIGSTGGKVCMHLHLSLPLVSSSLWQRDGIIVASIHKARISNLRPAWSIPELHRRRDTLPHIKLAVRIETFPFFLTLLTGQHKAPGNRTVGLIINKH